MKDSDIIEILEHLQKINDNRLAELIMNLLNETQILKDNSYKDELTKVYNRRILSEEIEYDVLVMCDLDNFKNINDKHGHNIGDNVLVDVSNELRSMIRNKDIICRYGGDEFTILFKDCTVENIVKRLENLGNKIKELEAEKGIDVTLSFGLSERADGKSIEEIIHEADKALYESKNTGKNKITIFRAPLQKIKIYEKKANINNI